MKHRFIIMAAAVLAAACEKQPINPEGVTFDPVAATIEVSIDAAPETKMDYTLDGNVLKCSWKEGDKISLVSYYSTGPYGGAFGEYVANDVFTAQSAGQTVKFKGTFSNPTPATGGTIGVKIIYPALDGTPLASPKEPQNNQESYGPFYVGNDKFLHLDASRKYIQPSENSRSNLEYYTLMIGEADVNELKSGHLTTVATIQHFTYVIKADLTMPDNGKNYVIKRVGIVGQTTESTDVHVPILANFGSADFKTTTFNGGKRTQLWTYMHDVQENGDPSNIGVVFNKGATTSVYFVGGFANSTEYFKVFKDLSKLKIVAEGTKGGNSCTLSYTWTASGEISLQSGKFYRLSATLAEE